MGMETGEDSRLHPSIHPSIYKHLWSLLCMRSWERGRGWQNHSPSPHRSPIVWLGSPVHGALGGKIWQSGWGKSNIRTACDLVQSTRELGIQRA